MSAPTLRPRSSVPPIDASDDGIIDFPWLVVEVIRGTSRCVAQHSNLILALNEPAIGDGDTWIEDARRKP